jgi:amino acid adenylation domain-containing protein
MGARNARSLIYLIDHLLTASALSRPDAVAVLNGNRSITYGELDERASRVAALIRKAGVERGDRVAVYIDKSIEAVTAVYGVLRAGAAYVPLDPQAPPARLAYIARDASTSVLLTGVAKADTWCDLVREGAPIETIVALDSDRLVELPPGVRILTAADIASADADMPAVGTVDSDLAYILYTSGSTGAPKGVMLTHRNCLAFIEWAVTEFEVTRDDRLSSHAPFHFDLSTFDLYAAASAGAPLVLVPPSASVLPVELRRFVEDSGITVWYSVPSVLTMLALRSGLQGGELPCLRTILFAGEVFPTPHLRRLTQLLPHVRFANLYGPTETNVCTWWEVAGLSADDDSPIPIGRAIANVDVFSLTEDGRPARTGEVGELCVRGPTVMQGYLGDPERTVQRLVPNPIGGILTQAVYRTGDLVQEQPDGNYRFLGRRDAQIKSRGYRIELGDVEAALYAHPSVVECAVVAVADEFVTNRLRAFVTTRAELSEAELVAFCARRIPPYMIPDELEFRQELPRTATGKVNRQALSAEAR